MAHHCCCNCPASWPNCFDYFHFFFYRFISCSSTCLCKSSQVSSLFSWFRLWPMQQCRPQCGQCHTAPPAFVSIKLIASNWIELNWVVEPHGTSEQLVVRYHFLFPSMLIISSFYYFFLQEHGMENSDDQQHGFSKLQVEFQAVKSVLEELGRGSATRLCPFVQ